MNTDTSPDCYACDGQGHTVETIHDTDGHEQQRTELCTMCGGTQVAW